MQTTTRIRSTKKFKALLAVLGDDDKALAAYHRAHPEAAPVEMTEVEKLVAAGFTEAEANKALGIEPVSLTKAERKAAKAAAKEAPVSLAKPEPLAEKDALTEFITERGFTYARGRVYLTKAVLEGAARTMRNEKPTIVQTEGVTRAVLLSKVDGTTIAAQNIITRKEG